MNDLRTSLKARRRQLGLSQRALADRVDVSRQAINAIEGGRQIPSTLLALRLSDVLDCRVEQLFELSDPSIVEVKVPPDDRFGAVPEVRAVAGRVDGVWVAHPLKPDRATVSDGTLSRVDSGTARLRPFDTAAALERNVLIAGCAPVLGALSQRVAERCPDARVRWVHASSTVALELLRKGLVHIAGIHFHDSGANTTNDDAVRRLFTDRAMVGTTLTNWTQGLLVRDGNPRALRDPADLLQPDVTFARRPDGAGATRLLAARLGERATEVVGPIVEGHEDVATMVQLGVVDAGIAVEGVAVNRGLEFVPYAEEAFDLILPAERTDVSVVRRVLEVLDSGRFRDELASHAGYDARHTGQMRRISSS